MCASFSVGENPVPIGGLGDRREAIVRSIAFYYLSTGNRWSNLLQELLARRCKTLIYRE